MHKSQLGGFIIDCKTDDIDAATQFWSRALGLEVKGFKDPGESNYRGLVTQPEEIHLEVQQVDHDSRVHLDIETNDIDAEVARLESLGARRLKSVRKWVVMEAPTGQVFCVVEAHRAKFDERANCWGE